MQENPKYTMMLVYCCGALWLLWLLASVLPLPVDSEHIYAARLACYIFLTLCMEVVGITSVFYFTCPQIPWRIGIMMSQAVPLHLIAWGAQPGLVWLPVFCSFLGTALLIIYLLFFQESRSLGAN